MKKPKIKNIVYQNIPWRFRPLLSEEAASHLKSASSIALAILAGAGIMTLSAIAPNVISAIGHFTLKRGRGRSNRLRNLDKKTAETFYYLKRSGLIRLKANKKDFLVKLTELGRKKAELLDFQALYVPKAKKWDKKWWLVAADIPTRDHRWGADLLRRKLKEMNFYPLQRTLWVYPHDPRKQLEFIISRFHVQHFVTLMEINRLDKEDELKVKKFYKTNNIL